MRSKRSHNFRKLLRELPLPIKRQAYAAYRRFKRDPYHPSLHFKRVGLQSPVYSVRIGNDYRALGRREEDDLIIWVWIGSHSEYDKLLRKS